MTRTLIYFTYFFCVLPFVMSLDLERIQQIMDTPNIPNKLLWSSTHSEGLKYKSVFLSNIMRGRASSPTKDNKGYAYNCGEKNHTFDLTWEPREVSNKVTITFNMTAPEYFPGGIIRIMSLFGGEREFWLVRDACKEMTYFGFTCPIEKGQNVFFSLVLENDGTWRSGYHMLDMLLILPDWQVYGCADAAVRVT